MQLGSYGEVYNGDYAPLPERYQAAYRYGVRFFEIRYPKLLESPIPLFLPFDIVVEEDYDLVRNKTHYNSRILCGNEAQIRFEPVNKHGVAIGFMFDDEFWHNRVIAIDTKWLSHNMTAVHHRDGLIPGTVARMEIDALENVLYTDVDIIKHMDENGRELTYYTNEKESKRSFTPVHEDKGHYLENGTMRDKTKFAKSLIAKYSRNKYGWTDCEEFRKEIVPQVNEIIKQKRLQSVAMQPNSQNAADVLRDALSKLDPTTIINILNDVKQITQPSTPSVPVAANAQMGENTMSSAPLPVSDFDKSTSVDEPDYHFTKFGLNRKRVEELHTIAKGMGVAKYERMNKETLIEEILKKQDGDQAKQLQPSEEIQEEEEVIR